MNRTTTTGHQIPFPERDPEDLLTLSEAAEILRMPINTLRWWRQTGNGPEFFKIGRHLVTTVGDLRRYIREQRHNQHRP
jgi:Helix-turn-helix domain